MLQNLKTLFRSLMDQGSVADARVPDGMRIYAVGDIHGRDDLLEVLLEKIVRDAASKQAAKNCIIYIWAIMSIADWNRVRSWTG